MPQSCMTADLHIHTKASDGQWDPSAIGREAAERGLRVIAVTDHDTVAGLEQAITGAPASMTIIPGIELSSDYQGAEVHILGYWIDYHHPPLLRLLNQLREERSTRTETMVQRLNALGLAISLGDVRALAGDAASGRLHIATALENAGYCSSKGEAFERWLGLGKPGYVPRERLGPVEAIRSIREAGGTACLAHPVLTRNDSLIPELVSAGLSGIEVIHSAHHAKDRRHYWRLAAQWNLAPVGGSDCHGPGGKDHVLLGHYTIPDTWVKGLQIRAQKSAMNSEAFRKRTL